MVVPKPESRPSDPYSRYPSKSLRRDTERKHKTIGNRKMHIIQGKTDHIPQAETEIHRQ